MKKFAVLTLAFSLFLGSLNVTSASSVTFKPNEDQVALSNIGITLPDSEVITKSQVKDIILSLNPNYSESHKDLITSLDSSDSITEEEFYSIFLTLLGYGEEVSKEDDIISFATTVGLNPICASNFDDEALSADLYDCLKAKTNTGREYFEVLIENGFLSDYNEGKDVPSILVFDGKTQPIFNHNNAIYEKVYVEAPLDTDSDNKRDLIEVWIKRPAETEQGMKVPTIYEVSPYVMGTNDDLYITHNVDEDLTVVPEYTNDYEDIKFVPEKKKLPAPRKTKGHADDAKVEPFDFGGWYNYFFTRGYAVVFSGGIGTRGSEGMTSTGDTNEIISTEAVIDWLNGRTKAYTNKTDNIEVEAYWSTGNVGMSGRSYRGTLPIGTAMTGVKGLKTIVPVAAISNWYDYYRANGLNVAGEGWQGDDADLLAIYCMSRMLDPEDYATVKEKFEASMDAMREDQDRITGDYNTFWDERNYLRDTSKLEASVLIVHGLSDWNVKPKQFDALFKALEERDIPRKIILHQGEHMSINNLAGIDFNDILNRWFDYWLYDIDNNVMNTVPTAIIQNNTDLSWEGFSNWPVDGEATTLYLDTTDNNKLSFTPVDEQAPQTFVDDLSLSGYSREELNGLDWRNAIVSNPENERQDRLAYVSEPLTKDVQISGTINLSLTASLNAPTGIISAMLVDYGNAIRPTIETEVVVPNGIIYGGNAGSDDIINFVMEDKPSSYKIISRGWMDAQNRLGILSSTPLTPGTEYTFNLDLEPMNYTIKAGHRLGLILYSTDAEYTMRPLSVTEFTVNPSKTSIQLPVVDGLNKW